MNIALIVREVAPNSRAKGGLCGVETIDFHESTESPWIPGVQCYGEIIEIRKETIP